MLVECLVVIAVGAMVMGIAVTLLATVLRIEGAARDDVHYDAAVFRLAHQFRRDVHAAVALVDDRSQPGDNDDGQSWRFELPQGRTVTYRLRPAGLARTERSGEKVLRRESFALPPQRTAAIERQGDGDSAILSLLILPATDAAGATTLRIDALLAHDHRLARPLPATSEDSDG